MEHYEQNDCFPPHNNPKHTPTRTPPKRHNHQPPHNNHPNNNNNHIHTPHHQTPVQQTRRIPVATLKYMQTYNKPDMLIPVIIFLIIIYWISCITKGIAIGNLARNKPPRHTCFNQTGYPRCQICGKQIK